MLKQEQSSKQQMNLKNESTKLETLNLEQYYLYYKQKTPKNDILLVIKLHLLRHVISWHNIFVKFVFLICHYTSVLKGK